MDSNFATFLIIAGTMFFIVVGILAILMPLFVFKIRNEMVKLNYMISVIDKRLENSLTIKNI